MLNLVFVGGSRKFPSPGFLRKGEISVKTTRSLTWLENYASKCGDKLPDSNRIHLPSCLTKGDVFSMMKRELADIGEEGCQEAVFFRHWRTDLRYIAIPKVKIILPKILTDSYSAFHTDDLSQCAVH